jgi:hypothetical protein
MLPMYFFKKIHTKIHQNEFLAKDEDLLKGLKNEIVYLKNMLNLRNKSFVGKQDIISKLQTLERENKKLRASNVSKEQF